MKYVWAICLVVTALFVYTHSTQSKPIIDEINLGERLAVVELFTSQSCSSCPPADHILKQLSHYEGIIALGCHVTYWDHLHWKDTLSQEFCTQRQRLYAATTQSNRVFTPELRLNGRESVIGSRAKDVKQLLENTSHDVQRIDIKAESEGLYKVTMPELFLGQDITLSLIQYEKEYTQTMERGENGGRTVEYVNAVSSIETVPWDQKKLQFSIEKKEALTGNQGLVLLIQKDLGGGVGPVLAAGRL